MSDLDKKYGKISMTGIDHLHQETKVLPIRDHAMLLTEQYVLAMHLPGHPGQKHLDRPPPPRDKKKTALDFKDDLAHLPAVVDKRSYKQGLKSLHTSAVQKVKNDYTDNRVLNARPPEIHPDELTLTRRARTSLSQLRSGFSRKVNECMHRLDPETPNTCPSCNQSPHDVPHLFNCNSNPTRLKPIDLWKKPREVFNFLELDGNPDEPNG